MEFAVAPFASADPAELIVTLGAGHVLTGAIFLYEDIALWTVGDDGTGLRIFPLLDAFVLWAGPTLAVIVLATEAAGILLAYIASDSTLLTGLSEVDYSLAVWFRALHVILLVFGNDSISEKFTIFLLHLLAADIEHVLVGGSDLAADLRAEQLLETLLLGD